MAPQPPAAAPDNLELPLKAASARLLAAEKPPQPDPPKLPKKLGRRPRKVSPDLVIGMKAAGVPLARIGQALGVTANTVTNTLNREPDARERIATLREALRGIKMEKAHEMEGKMWARLEKEVETGGAKDVDAIARALLASEKIQAAASGEAHASGAAPPALPTNLDLKVLLQTLITP